MATRTRRSAEEAREALLDAAEQVVRESGPAGLRIQEVARIAGTTHPNLLHHFKNREGLLIALSTRSLARVTNLAVEAVIEMAAAPADEQADRLKQLFRTLREGKHGRLLAWLLLSGRLDESALPDLGPLLAASGAHVPDVDPDARRNVLMLLTLALVGEAVAGEIYAPAFGLEPGAEGRQHFLDWLAELVLDLPRLEDPPAP